jgi:hypothetical protein
MLLKTFFASVAGWRAIRSGPAQRVEGTSAAGFERIFMPGREGAQRSTAIIAIATVSRETFPAEANRRTRRRRLASHRVTLASS